MKTLKLFFLVGAFGIMAMGCTDKQAEKKIAELESRLAEVEGTNSTPAPTINPTPVAEPEEKPEGPLPSFAFAEEDYDFGTINEGDVVEHIFKFTNDGEQALVIQSAKGSCGCTVPEWPKEPIGVGETGEILVKFNSKGKPNVQNKTVTITANTWPKITKLRIKAMVTPAAPEAGAEGPVK